MTDADAADLMREAVKIMYAPSISNISHRIDTISIRCPWCGSLYCSDSQCIRVGNTARHERLILEAQHNERMSRRVHAVADPYDAWLNGSDQDFTKCDFK